MHDKERMQFSYHKCGDFENNFSCNCKSAKLQQLSSHLTVYPVQLPSSKHSCHHTQIFTQKYHLASQHEKIKGNNGWTNVIFPKGNLFVRYYLSRAYKLCDRYSPANRHRFGKSDVERLSLANCSTSLANFERQLWAFKEIHREFWLFRLNLA